MTIKAVFFDLDDTLCDARAAWAAASAAALGAVSTRLGGTVPSDHITVAWRAIHVPLFASLAEGALTMAEVRSRRLRHLMVALGVPDDPFADAVNYRLGEMQLDLLKLFPDTGVLEDLRSRGLHVGIITNGAGDAHPDSQRSKAARLDLLDRVDSFYASDDLGHRKPDPRAFQPALRAADCAPGEAMYVGDSLDDDIPGANAAGIFSVFLQRTMRLPSSFPPGARPAHVVGSLRELLSLDMLSALPRP